MNTSAMSLSLSRCPFPLCTQVKAAVIAEANAKAEASPRQEGGFNAGPLAFSDIEPRLLSEL